jgi:cytochrome b6-f complex iron-sulfur subunit
MAAVIRSRPAEARFARRRMLRAGFAAAATVAGAQVASLVPSFFRINRVEGLGGPVAVGPLDEILATFARTNDKPILHYAGRFFLLHAPGGVVAAYRKCTHLGCMVPFNDAEDRFHCPCHHSVYDKRTAVVVDGPAPKPLQLFHVRQEDGGLIVEANPLAVIDRTDNRWDPAHVEIRA